MDDLLVNQVCKHLNGSLAEKFVVATVRFLELVDDSVYDEPDDVWQLGIDSCEQSSIHMRESRARHLCLHDSLGKKSLTPH